jgi:dTDP-glucose pyrophosphorylase
LTQAVVMAAGEGRRLQPFTERWAKPVLPIDRRPVIVTLMEELQVAGIGESTVVVGHLAEQIESVLAGTPNVRFAVQPEPLGSADAVLRAGLKPPYLVAGADTVFTPGDVGRFLRDAEGFDGALAVRREPPPDPPHRWAVRIEAGLVTQVLDDDPANPLAGAPLWVVGAPVARFLPEVSGPPHELKDAVQAAVDSGARIAGIEIGRTRDLTHPLDLVVENFPYLSEL